MKNNNEFDKQRRVQSFGLQQNPPHPALSTRRGRAAFTIAEILISLTIIGLIAAITLPSLRANINETTWNTQRKALYSRLSQAISMMPSLNGYGIIPDNAAQTRSKAAEVFVTEGLSKVFKIKNICASTNLKKCGISPSIKNTANSKTDMPSKLSELLHTGLSTYNTIPSAFETNNGESIIVYYNPLCRAEDFAQSELLGMAWDDIDNTSQNLCANFVYDLNGRKGPNKFGKDIGAISVFYAVEPYISTVNAYGKNFSMTFNEARTACRNLGNEYRLPTIEELMTVFVNRQFYASASSNRYWSSTPAGNNKFWTMYPILGIRRPFSNSTKLTVRCVKR